MSHGQGRLHGSGVRSALQAWWWSSSAAARLPRRRRYRRAVARARIGGKHRSPRAGQPQVGLLARSPRHLLACPLACSARMPRRSPARPAAHCARSPQPSAPRPRRPRGRTGSRRARRSRRRGAVSGQGGRSGGSVDEPRAREKNRGRRKVHSFSHLSLSLRVGSTRQEDRSEQSMGSRPQGRIDISIDRSHL